MPKAMTSVRLDIKDQKTRKDFEDIISSLTDFQLHKYSDDPKTCDLWILEIGEDPKKEFELIQTIKSLGAEKEVFLTSSALTGSFDPGLKGWSERIFSSTH
jgi:hypothetical protein